MDPREVKSAEDARTLIEDSMFKHIKVGVFDIDGVMRGKYMSRDKFLSSLTKGFGFCDVVLGWDVKDQLYDNVAYTGWHTGYPDAQVRIIPSSCRTLPLESSGVFFLAEFADKAEAICPRGLLKRVVGTARDMGLEVDCGFEYEFFVFEETPHSIREKSFQGLTPMAPSEFGYSVIRNSVESDTYLSLLQLADDMDFPLEGLHEETGPGVLEAAITHDEAINAADKAALFKTFTKIALQKQGKMATFMAKWSKDYPGQSGHIHLSLKDNKGLNLFYDGEREANMSATMRHFIAGQQKLMPELMAMIAPTVNSYRRLIPGFWAPTEASVGIDNRTCAIRVIPGDVQSQRLEYRIGAADANPYIILAAVIASGLWGMENKLEPECMVEGNAYEQTFPEHLQLPSTLWDAAQRLKNCQMARDFFGSPFVEHFAATREWEEREYRKYISMWELERYFEII
ncbi:glutamine synthetase [Hahella sp. KA22]|uniref:glutamine synthetase family protein n=1 Tax=Hahella sp. KA22 TaxID=1628392 RepID=UPI000FDCF6E5|nr:glutamine synthetase [Hahella sp. KA22]AZZ90196.1 glutamine synthetase [Hahella sp. KA22]QAY53566.1 glutamine synthetase [Hahella sp. KA22]